MFPCKDKANIRLFPLGLQYFQSRLNTTEWSNGTAVVTKEYYFNNWMTLLSQLPLLVFTLLNSFLYQRSVTGLDVHIMCVHTQRDGNTPQSIESNQCCAFALDLAFMQMTLHLWFCIFSSLSSWLNDSFLVPGYRRRYASQVAWSSSCCSSSSQPCWSKFPWTKTASSLSPWQISGSSTVSRCDCA